MRIDIIELLSDHARHPPPVEPPVTTSKRRQRDRNRPHRVKVLAQIIQTRLDILIPRRFAPIPLSRKINYPIAGKRFPDVHPSGLHKALSAVALIVLEHCWIALLECQSDTGTHHANTIHSVDADIGLRIEYVALRKFEHDLSFRCLLNRC
nr:hypothetical protein [Bradyrhizobium sp. CCGE-LA001]